MSGQRKLLVIQAAALGHDFASTHAALWPAALRFQPLDPLLPGLTCSAQATFRTATLPELHGMPANGVFSREFQRPFFWEQSARLVQGARIWDDFRAAGRRTALLFWQQSLGESVDSLLSPTPIHKHGGGMIQSCYSQPAGLYERLCATLGSKFNLLHYWGPLASPKSSRWIAEATSALLCDRELAPDLCLTYLPALDYDLQRHGPDSSAAARSAQALACELKLLLATAEAQGYETLVWGDYAIKPCRNGACFPNRALLDAGLFETRSVKGRLYPDFHRSRAFAMVDHEIAHVYVREPRDLEAVRAALAPLQGVTEVLDATRQKSAGLAHPRSGELVLTAAEGSWLAYPWWQEDAEAPDYAGHVDIHSKPGYDPCELFFGWPPGTVSRNTARVQGSHGRTGADRRTAWACTCPLPSTPQTLPDLAAAVRTWLAGR